MEEQLPNPEFERRGLAREIAQRRVYAQQYGKGADIEGKGAVFTALRFERWLGHPVDEVWASITEPDRLTNWMARPTSELIEGGRVGFTFDNTGYVLFGTVTRLDRPTSLQIRWETQEEPRTLPSMAIIAAAGDGTCGGDFALSEVVFELIPDGDGGTVLTFTHSLTNPEKLHYILAGWHNHLDLLGESLDAKGAVEFPWGRWDQLRASYAEDVALGSTLGGFTAFRSPAAVAAFGR